MAGDCAYRWGMSYPTPHEAFRDAIAALGGPYRAAPHCGISRQAIEQALAAGRPVSHNAVLKLAAASGIPRGVLRPDLYPGEADAAGPATPGSEPA